MGSHSSFCVLIDSNGSLQSFMRGYGFKWDFMGPYKSLCVRIGPYGFL